MKKLIRLPWGSRDADYHILFTAHITHLSKFDDKTSRVHLSDGSYRTTPLTIEQVLQLIEAPK